MKTLIVNANRSRRQRAFTLVEAMITCAVLIVILGSVICCNLFGLAMAARQQIWLGASDDSARTLSTLVSDIRSSTSMEVGSYTNGVFTQMAATGQQSGNALLLYTNDTTNTQAVLYYYYSASNLLMQTNCATTAKIVSANEITNDATHPIFTEVDYTGTALSNATPLTSISVYMSFIKLQDPQILIENGSVVDLYQVITTVSPRLRL